MTVASCRNATQVSLLLLMSLILSSSSFNSFFQKAAPAAPSVTKRKIVESKSPIFEYLKFDGNPKFDVLAKTRNYVASQKEGKIDEGVYAKDYVLRGPVIGPITRSDLNATNNSGGGEEGDGKEGGGGGFDLKAAYPDLEVDTFGLTIDPENPYRCFYFQRWRGTHSGDLDSYGTVYPATNVEMETPISVFSVVWNPEGLIVYEQVGAVVDRIEGNTAGKAAVFGLLHNAGLKLSASPGDKVFSLIQRIGHLAGNLGRSWSKEEDIPDWWVSPSRGADETEQW